MKLIAIAVFVLTLGFIPSHAVISKPPAKPKAPPKPNYLFNPTFASGVNGWHGIGDIVYLKPDGTESRTPVKGAEQVLKIPLKPTDPRDISQEFSIPIPPSQLSVSFDVRASRDFKRSVQPADYTTPPVKANSTKVSKKIIIPQADSWVRLGPGWLYRTASATRVWKPVRAIFKKGVIPTQNWVITIGVPCGRGAIYIRNVAVTN